MDSLFVAWQQPSTREWIPVARLDWDGEEYRFSYTQGALRAESFEPFGRMKGLRVSYHSAELFPFFLNRLISKSRPEYEDYLTWMNFNSSNSAPIFMLGMTGGLRGTDSIELFPMPKRNAAGTLEIDFFARGLRHFNQTCVDAANSLVSGDRLLLVKDLQNDVDTFALFMRTENPIHLVGYVPRFYAKDLGKLLQRFPSEVEVRVQRVNPDAPLSMRLLCSASAPWPDDFAPLKDDPDFVSLAPELASMG
jgi:hypothetical protein